MESKPEEEKKIGAGEDDTVEPEGKKHEDIN